MQQLPSHVLVLHDGAGTSFGVLRFAPREDAPSKGECLFDIKPAFQSGSVRSEARWLAKRHYVRSSEHRFKLADDGSLTISQGDFRCMFHVVDEGTMATRAPDPPITGLWSTDVAG